MKTRLLILLLIVPMIFGCRKFDDSHLWDSINSLNSRVERLETICDKMNTNISSLQTIVQALQTNDAIKSVTSLPNGEGYTINFVSGKSINIYNGRNGTNGADGTDGKDGQDGKNGVTPVISVKKDIDGIYYWTVNGEWLIVDGNKVKAVGTDGADGENGTDGKDGEDGVDGENGLDGTDGKDGITPKFKIEDGYWYISYDNELSWKQLGKATEDNGLNGSDGESFFKGVSIENGYVCFILNDAESTIIKLPFVSETELIVNVKTPGTLRNIITEGQERTVITLKVAGNINEDDLKYIRIFMSNIEYLDLSGTTLTNCGFSGLSRLKSVILPDTCVNMGGFDGCNILQRVYAPNATASTSLAQCDYLEKITVASISATDDAWVKVDTLVITGKNGIASYPSFTKSKIIILSESISDLALCTVNATFKTQELIFSDGMSLTEIGRVPRPDLGYRSWWGSPNIEKITFNNNLKRIDGRLFNILENLIEVHFPQNCALEHLGNFCISAPMLTSFEIPENVETIDPIFQSMPKVETVIFRESNVPCCVNEFLDGAYSTVKNIYCLRKTPPYYIEEAGGIFYYPAHDYMFAPSSFLNTCMLYVPSSSYSLYKNDEQWGLIKRITPINE